MHKPVAASPVRTPGWLIATLIVAVFIAVTALAATSGRPPRQVPPSGAEAYIAADGTRTILTGPRSTQVRWTSHQPGIRPFVDGSPEFVRAAVEDPDSGHTGAWLIESEDDEQGTHPHLLRLDRDGLRTWTALWPEPRTFTPPRPEIPADPRAGQEQTTTGTVAGPEGTVAYSSTLHVLDAPAAGPDCLEFRRTDRVGVGPEQVSSRTRCPGLGVVALALPGETDATASWTLAADWPEAADPRPGLELTGPADGPLTGLRPTPLTFERAGLATLVPPAGPPQLMGDRLVIANTQTGNIVWAEPDESEDTYVPGPWVSVAGDILHTARCGDVLAGATSQRRLVAHDGAGRWLWSTDLPDVAGSPPVRAGDRFLVATKDGSVHAISCRDGTVAWSADSVVSVQPPVAGAAGVLVAGGDGVRLLDPATGRMLWERGLPDRITGLAQIGDLVLVGDNGNRLFALDPATGGFLSTFSLPDQAEEVHRLGEVLVVRTTTRVLGLTGPVGEWRVAWSVPFDGYASLADERHVVVADLREIVVLDSAGTLLERRALDFSPGSAGVFLTRTPDGFLASDTSGTVIRWRR